MVSVVFATMLLFVTPDPAWSRQNSELPELVVMSAVSDNPQSLISSMRPLADYVEKKLAPLGVKNVEILIAENTEQMIRFIRDGRVDWITETAYSAALLEKRAGAEIALRKWKQGVASYRSILFVRKDSGIESLDQIIDRSVAFQHPGSTTGYFVPRSVFQNLGMPLKSLRSVREKAMPGFVNYVFSGGEYNSAQWVHKGLVSAAVLSNLDWQRDDIVPASIKQDLKVIYTSPPLPRALELLRSDLDPRIKAVITETLLAAHEDPQASEALHAYHGTFRFDRLDSASIQALGEIRKSLGNGPVPAAGAP
ncbi:MAG: phosphate/phosphite/phosphonate ABC transporter substrate-binding protein [Gammaproteobacteria bacterium]|nr:phosphate/phosphite/phosphonate ABC transporter substrate-binding protein [Gammaproteobacteria bacterium]